MMRQGICAAAVAVVFGALAGLPAQASIFDPNDNNGPSQEEDEVTGVVTPTTFVPATGTFTVGPVSGFFSDDAGAGTNSSGEPLADR